MARYREIHDYLRRLITETELDTLLPTIADLQKLFQVDGVQTIRDAYAPLLEEGLVEVQYRPHRRYVLVKKPEQRMHPDSQLLAEQLEKVEDTLSEGLRRVRQIRRGDYWETFDHADAALVAAAIKHYRENTQLVPEAVSRSLELEQKFIQRETGYYAEG